MFFGTIFIFIGLGSQSQLIFCKHDYTVSIPLANTANRKLAAILIGFRGLLLDSDRQ